MEFQNRNAKKMSKADRWVRKSSFESLLMSVLMDCIQKQVRHNILAINQSSPPFEQQSSCTRPSSP